MGKLKFKITGLITIAIIIVCIIAIVELAIKNTPDGTLLLILSFYVALIEGSVAVVAAADAAKGKWIEPVKRDLLAFYPLIAFIAILFLLFGFHLEIYPWTKFDHRWLNPPFFIIRNTILLFAVYLIAQQYVKASLSNKESKVRWAIVYLFAFVISQSMVAFDWVMSLEFPWVSTLFGGIFFMEAFYGGLALLGIISAFLIFSGSTTGKGVTKVLKDSATFIFGFALAWAGLFFAQYLVIWYGNLPFETSFFTKRMNSAPYSYLLWIHFFMLFIIPFVGLVAKKVKTSPTWVIIMSVVVLGGILIERMYYILPVTSINILWWIGEFVLVGFLLCIYFFNRQEFLKIPK
jgi:hypothetical protein